MATTLPIGAVIGASFNRVLSHPKQAFQAGLPYFILLLILGIVSALVLPADPAAFSGGAIVLALVFLVLQILVYTAMVVAWHRVTLLGYTADKGFFRVGFGQRELKFLGYSLLIYPPAVVVTLAFAVGGTVGLILGLVAFCALIFCAVRCSLVFPATAADHPTSLKDSWQQTSGHFWSMFAIFLLLAIILAVTIFVVSFVLGLVLGLLGIVGQIILLIVLIPLQLLIVFVSVSALSYIYRVLSGHPDPLAETV